MISEETINLVKQTSNIKDIIEKFVVLKRHGGDWIGSCPFHDEKTPSFHVSVAKGVYKCFGCGRGGNDGIQFLIDFPGTNYSYPDAIRYIANQYNIPIEEDSANKVYALPPWKNQTTIDNSVVKWFEGRGIKQNTLLKAKITSGIEWMPGAAIETLTIQFNYIRNSVLTNIKYRDTWKGFKLFKDAELIFYNLDSMIGKKEVWICEGEMDCLSLMEAGYDSNAGVISVPNGASKFTNNLAYVNNCIELFKDIDKIYLCLDNDVNGRKLRDELADRFGKYRCEYVEFKDSKDANECLMKYGIQGVIDSCSNKMQFPLQGAFTISDFNHEIDDMYINGLDRGVSIKLHDFGLRFVKGYITVVTGIPSHGKSEAVDEMTMRLNIRHNWKGAFYSPENKPTQLHFSKLARRIIGKKWDGENRITPEEKDQIKKFLEGKVWFIKPEKDFSLESVLNSIRELQERFGLDYFVIDAWNKLEHKGKGDTDYVGKALDELASFCEINNLHCFLVAHPTKIEKDKRTGQYRVPTLYDIAGSANFFNKADNGICIYRDFEKDISYWYRQKIKFTHWGWFGVSEYKYEPDSGRFYKEGYPNYSNWMNGIPFEKIEETQKIEAKPLQLNLMDKLEDAPF